MSELVLNYLNVAELSPVETVIAAGEGGFRATGVRLTGHTPDASDMDLIGNMSALSELARRAVDSGVAIATFSTFRLLAERTVADYLPVLEAGASLRVPTMAVNCFTTDEARAVALLAAVAEAAAPYGIKLALEFIPVSAVRTLTDAARVVRATGQSNIGINLDALHLQRSGGSISEIAGVDPKLLHSVHLCDAPLAAPADLIAEMRGGRLYPGEGELPLHELLDAAPRGIEIEVEVPNIRWADVPPSRRVRMALDATQAFLALHAQRSTAAAKKQK